MRVTAKATGTYSILEEEIQEHLADAIITPMSMDQEETREEFKPTNGEVASHDRLHTLLS